MPSHLKDFHPEIAQDGNLKDLHEKIDTLHGKIDALLALIRSAAEESKNPSPPSSS
jgi:hypothetical protein